MPAKVVHSLTTGRTIHVFVGRPGHGEIDRFLHEDLLRQSSPYLKSKIQSLNDTTSDTQERQLHLEHVNSKPFLQFVSWLHNEPLNVNDGSLVVSTYLLAHRFEVEPMKNDIVDTLRAHHASFGPKPFQKIVPMSELRRLCASLAPITNPNSNELLRYLVDQYTYYTRLWDRADLPFSADFELLLHSDILVMRWHLKTRDQLFIEMGITPEMVRSKSGIEAAAGKHHDTKQEGESERSPKAKRFPIKAIQVPAEREGCCYHEHMGTREDQPFIVDD